LDLIHKKLVLFFNSKAKNILIEIESSLATVLIISQILQLTQEQPHAQTHSRKPDKQQPT
jgi:hypothetical protein